MRQTLRRSSTNLPASNWGELPAPLLENIFARSPTSVRATRNVNKHWHRNCYNAIRDLQPDELNNNVTDFPGVENLDLSYVKVHPCDQNLNLLVRLPKLKSVNLFGCWRLSSIGLSNLQQLVHLKSLNLSNCHQLIDGDAAALALLSSLEHLALSRCSGFTDRSFSYISNLTGLKDLDLSNCENIALQPQTADAMRSLSRITAIFLSQNPKINDHSAAVLGALSTLQTLEINQCSVGNSGISRLMGLSELRTLNASQNHRIGSQVLDMRQLIALESLNLNFCSIRNESLEFLTEMRMLSALHLNFNEVTNQGIQTLKSMTQLKELSLCATANHLDPIAFEALTSLTSLKCNICHGNSQIRKRLIIHLPNLARLNNENLSKREVKVYRTAKNHRVNRSTKSISANPQNISLSPCESGLNNEEPSNIGPQWSDESAESSASGSEKNNIDTVSSTPPPNLEVPELIEHFDGDPKPNTNSSYRSYRCRLEKFPSFWECLCNLENYLLKKIHKLFRFILELVKITSFGKQ